MYLCFFVSPLSLLDNDWQICSLCSKELPEVSFLCSVLAVCQEMISFHEPHYSTKSCMLFACLRLATSVTEYLMKYDIVTHFEITRHRQISKVTHISADTRLIADSCSCSNKSVIAFQQAQSVIHFRSIQGHCRPNPRAHRTVESSRTVRRSSTEQWEAVQESRGSSKAGQVPTQRRQFDLEFRSLAGLAILLDQEEDSVQLVPEELPVLGKSCWRSWS
jgi:hypothetical protein